MGFLDDYEPVEDRIRAFWNDHPEGRIVTDMLPAPEGQWIVKAEVWRTAQELTFPDATGLAHEHVTETGVNSTSALENCETSAIGRALANLGYAAKGKRASREEMSKTKAAGVVTQPQHAVWLRDQVKIFKAWDEEEKNTAYTNAMTMLAFDVFDSMDKAKRIFAHMEGQYRERPIGQVGEDK